MATDRTATWNEDGSILWHTPTTNLDSAWSEDGSIFLDEYDALAGSRMLLFSHGLGGNTLGAKCGLMG